MVQILHPPKNHYIQTHPIAIMRQMYKEEGIGAWFKGLSVSMLSISNAIIYFMLYENLKYAI